MGTEIEYEDLPTDVRDAAEEGATASKTQCAVCESDLYYVPLDEKKHGYDEGYIDNSGYMKGNSSRWGGLAIEDTASLPRQLVPENGIHLCGSCLDVDTFERRGVVMHGVDDNVHVGAFKLGSILDSHYRYDSFDRSHFEEAFNDIARGERRVTVDGVTLTPSSREVTLTDASGEEVTVSVDDLESGENPTDYPLIAVGRTLFTPEEE